MTTSMSGKSPALLMLALASVAFLNGCNGCNPPPPKAVTTYHYDNLRTGWNPNEVNFSYANVGSTSFGLLHPVTLDDQVDTQPLIVPGETIAGGKHDVAYVATEGNTVYAIDASSGAILLQQKLGPPVPTPLGCNNNGPNVGINGTPVIDTTSNTMYVIAFTNDGPTYRIHALDLSTLNDKVSPVVVSATHTLTDGSTFYFNGDTTGSGRGSFQRQRPALLEANGNIYAGFGSFCDFGGSSSRGWLLGWQAGSLTPLPANQLDDRQTTAPNNPPNGRFLASIWMSGYGLAADQTGDIYFVTGNSDSNYDGSNSIQESVVKMSPDLTKVLGIFTPSNEAALDTGDTDFGSGGILLLQDQNPPLQHLAAAAGKDGRMFLLDRDNLGGFTSGGPDKVVGTFGIGGCWCGQSYFFGNNRSIVSSGGNSVNLWEVQNTPSVTLTKVASSPAIGGTQDPGFFTSVSSAGATEAIIWAVSRPNTSQNSAGQCVGDPTIYLYAFNAGGSGGGTLPQLFRGSAGTWPTCTGNANIVPVVANGKVYVASYQQLAIFGLK